jgi:hypothetical protein
MRGFYIEFARRGNAGCMRNGVTMVAMAIFGTQEMSLHGLKLG